MMKKHLFTLLLFQLICCQQFFAQTYILNEDFNSLISNIPSGWDNDDYTCSASSRWASYNDGYNGTRCLRFYVYSSAAGTYSVLKTPILNLSQNCVLRFKYKNYQSGDLQVFISLDAGVTYTTPISGILTTDSIDEWREMTIPLSAYVGQSNVRIVFYGISNYGSYNQYLDDVIVETLPICMTPPNVYVSNTSTTSIDISVLDANYANWELAYKVNETASSDTIVSISNSRTYTVNGLTPDTEYAYRVRRRCNDTTTSEWSSYDSIRTLTLSPDASPLCFTARNGSVTVRFDIKNVSHTIQYSTDSVNWSTYNSNTNVTINANQSVYFRAASNQTVATAFGYYLVGDLSLCSRFYFSTSNGGTVEGSGNIMSLYGPSCPNLPLPASAFLCLFHQCSLLTTPPALPATTLANNCYNGMFSSCTSLTTSPALPSTSLDYYCYCNMFQNCSSLSTLPYLPATSLAEGCYSQMFYNCSSIILNTSGPGKQWAITVSSTAYNSLTNMFTGTGGTMNGTPSINTIYYQIHPNTVTVGVNNILMGSVTGAGIYNIGDTATLTATPYYHYHFVNWSDGCISNPRHVVVSSDTFLTAIFELDKHVVLTSCSDGSITGAGTYDYGTTVALTATANAHYHFLRWSDGDTSNPRTIKIVCDTTFTAIFDNRYCVSLDDVNGNVEGIGIYEWGSTMTLIAMPNEHCHFTNWPDGDTAKSKSFTVTGDTTFTSLFAKDQHGVTATCEHGTITGEGIYEYGDIATLTVTPNKGYRFVNWNDGNDYNPRVFVVERDLSLEAICEEAPETGFDEAVDETPLFYIVGNTIYNPANESLMLFSASGKLLQQAENNIELTGYPAGVYIVVDEKGNSQKVLTR